MTDTPTPTEAIATNPGGDMTQGTANAHLETPDEMAATPTDIEVDTHGHVLTQPEPSTATATIENEPTAPPTLATAYRFQHAKVLRFEVSVGKDDDATDIERYKFLVEDALFNARAQGPLKFNNLTHTGGYYIIDGKVCLPEDYDPTTKSRKPGTYPPSWAGGPAKGREKDWDAANTEREPDPIKAAATSPVTGTNAARTTPKVQGTPESVVALAQGINLAVKGKRGRK